MNSGAEDLGWLVDVKDCSDFVVIYVRDALVKFLNANRNTNMYFARKRITNPAEMKDERLSQDYGIYWVKGQSFRVEWASRTNSVFIQLTPPEDYTEPFQNVHTRYWRVNELVDHINRQFNGRQIRLVNDEFSVYAPSGDESDTKDIAERSLISLIEGCSVENLMRHT